MKYNFFIVIIFICFFIKTSFGGEGGDELSDCLKECLKPLAKLHMSNSDMYLRYEEICTKLEPAAECSRKCSPLAHAQFHQLSANFRLHCVDFEEELEDHLSCLQKNTVKVEKKCTELCKQEDEENVDKQKALCKQNECNLKCHLKGLVEYCPESAKVQKKIAILKTRELERMREHETFNLLPFECQQLHDHKHVERILDDL